MPDLAIRTFKGADAASVKQLHVLSFQTSTEAKLVEELHRGGYASISLVAEQEGKIVGHVLFSRLSLEVDGRPISALALAPIAVDLRLQKLGIGSALIAAGHERARSEGWEVSIVLGEPTYYNRFGYDSGMVEHIASPYAGEYLMGLEFVPGVLAGRTGSMAYAEPFYNLG